MPADVGDTGWGRVAPTVVAFGALASAALVVLAMRRVGSPLLLQVLFAGWVAAPFALLAAGLVRSPRWPAPVRATLATVSVLVCVASLVAYAIVAFAAAKPRAPVFVLVPPLTSILAAIAVVVAALRTRRPRSSEDPPA